VWLVLGRSYHDCQDRTFCRLPTLPIRGLSVAPPIHPTDEAARKPRPHAGAFVCHSRQKSLRGARRSAPPGFEMIALNVLG